MSPKSKTETVESSLQATASRWLTEMGCSPQALETPDSDARWQLSVQWPAGSTWSLNLWQPLSEPDLLKIEAHTTVNEVHQELVAALSRSKRIDFLRGLETSLLNVYTRLSVVVGGKPTPERLPHEEIPERFVVSSSVYSDGLSKSLFFDKLLAVHQTRMQGIVYFQSRFNEPPTTEVNGDDDE